jgi:hypothetical protein
MVTLTSMLSACSTDGSSISISGLLYNLGDAVLSADPYNGNEAFEPVNPFEHEQTGMITLEQPCNAYTMDVRSLYSILVDEDGSNAIYLYNRQEEHRQYGGFSMQFDPNGVVWSISVYPITKTVASSTMPYSFYWVKPVHGHDFLSYAANLPPIHAELRMTGMRVIHCADDPNIPRPFDGIPDFNPPRLIPFEDMASAYSGVEIKAMIEERVCGIPLFYVLTTALLPTSDLDDSSIDATYLYCSDQGEYDEMDVRLLHMLTDEEATANSGILTLDGYAYFTLVPFYPASTTEPVDVHDINNSLLGVNYYDVNVVFVIVYPIH